ncbi:uncharacterized protein LOC115884694 isoform X2 [Sitophilus oryzae]|uniref:Uncharacterized protein LOC115884694 isoform X2 n=1 Tax=Sitophilus oryzae TaxID=7048 RepID=A0A6J2Y8B4_SITOR|nr:uncharacterized protein LOC115884694 isoform X2 [Sitophilus oryzae]
MSKLQVFLSLALLAATARGQATFCHFCNTERDGLPCEDPIDSSRIQVQRCADLAVASNLESFPALDGSANNAAQVCVTLSYTYFDRNVTTRGCDATQTLLYGINYAACEYYDLMYSSYITNFVCTSCQGELCNAAETVEVIEEDEVAEDQQPDGNGADIMSISARFIIVTVLALIML